MPNLPMQPDFGGGRRRGSGKGKFNFTSKKKGKFNFITKKKGKK